MKSEADTLTSAFLWLTMDWEKPTPSSTGENDWIYLCRLGGGGLRVKFMVLMGSGL